MRNRGVRRPGRSVLICAALAIGGAAAVVCGNVVRNATGDETPWSGFPISVGMLVALLGLIMLPNFLWGMRVFGAMGRDEGVIARWTVAAPGFDRFRETERRLEKTERGNDYRLPARTPPQGVEVIFSGDGVLIGDTYFGLSTTGVSRYTSVRIREANPPLIEFGTMLTSVVRTPQGSIMRNRGVLRVPTAPTASLEAARVLRHYRDVVDGRALPKPHFWRRRVRWGLIATVGFAVMAGVGFALAEHNQELWNAPLFMAVTGVIVALGGLLAALLAHGQDRRARRRL